MEKQPVKLTTEMMVRDLLRDPPFGELGQLFILEAIRHYAGMVASTPAPTEDGNGIVSAKAWHSIAVDVSNRINANNAL